MLKSTALKAKIVMKCTKCRLLLSVTFDTDNSFKVGIQPVIYL